MDTMGEVRGIWTASESHEISSLIPPCARCSLVSMVCLSCTRHIVSPLSPRRLGRVPFWAYTTQWPLCLWALEDGRIECIPKHLSSHLFALLACYRGGSLIWDRLCTHPILLLEVFLVENYFSLFGSNFRCVLFRLYEGETTTKTKSEGRFGVTRLRTISLVYTSTVSCSIFLHWVDGANASLPCLSRGVECFTSALCVRY